MGRRAVVSTASPAVVVVEIIVGGWTLLLLSLITHICRVSVLIARLLVRRSRRRAIAWRVHILGRRTLGLRCARTRRPTHTTTRARTRTVVRYALASGRRYRAAHFHLRLPRRHGHTPARRSEVVLRIVAWRAVTGARWRTTSLVWVVLWWVLTWSSTGAVHWSSPAISVSRRRRHWPARRSHTVPSWTRPLAA